MANTFTPLTSRALVGPNSRSFLIIEGTLVIDTPGGAEIGDLPADLFGFTKVVAVWPFANADDSGAIIAFPSVEQTSLLISDGAGALADLLEGTYQVALMGLN
jgi:hypothetical protein